MIVEVGDESVASLALTADRPIRLWHLPTGQVVTDLECTQDINAVTMSADGCAALAVLGHHNIRSIGVGRSSVVVTHLRASPHPAGRRSHEVDNASRRSSASVRRAAAAASPSSDRCAMSASAVSALACRAGMPSVRQ